MMETVLSRSVRLIYTGGVAVGLGLLAQPALAQEKESTQKVVITGSSIKRIQKEGQLPIQVLTQEDIKKSGVSTATDLIQNLPAMQGFVPASSSVNGGGAGATTAALHSLPSKYTLVLIDGQRMAPVALGSSQGGGFAVNIESIPLDAVERVEILTDGASALYGSDAIAGVVNFILKKNKTDGSAFVNIRTPQKDGGKSWNAGISKGFGDLEVDKFNILLSYSHDEQKNLLATQRSFSKVGAFFPFSYGGKDYVFDQRTGNTEPANITFRAAPINDPTNIKSYTINPSFALNGNCGNPALTGPQPVANGNVSCRFNYAATVENIPASTRDSGLIKASFKLNEDTIAWGSLALSQFSMKAEYAPSAQPLGINTTNRFPSLYNAYVAPYLAANGLVNASSPLNSATLGYRSVLVGGRTDDYKTDARHFALGISGSAMGWTYDAALTLSHSNIKDVAAGGYSDADKLNALVAAGTYDPVTGRGAESLRSALVNGTTFSSTDSELNNIRAGAQRDLFDMGGGKSIISITGDYTQTRYKTAYSPLILSQSGFSTQPASSNFPIGGNYGQVPFDASRNNWGVSGEWLLPISKNFEATVAARYDSYGKTHSRYVFSEEIDKVTGLQMQKANADLGDTFSSGTYKLGMKWTPTNNVLVRGSYGTGFKAPNITEIAGALTFGGSTAGSYSCPIPGSSGCLPGSAQYDIVSGPNGSSGATGLKPEKSKQWTLGLRVEPMAGLSLGADLWDVEIKNQISPSGTPEQVGFADPVKYRDLFIAPYADPAGFTTIAYKQIPSNGDTAKYRGLDWDFSYRTNIAWGKLGTSWTGTYMLKQEYSKGGVLGTDLAKFGPNNAVVFRTQMNLSATLQTGAFTNTLAMHYKSGYKDQTYPIGTSVFARNADGSTGASVKFDGLDVSSYTTFDWQGKYDYNKNFSVTAGIKNLFDRNPPLTLQNAGGGNQIGYDGRYADPLGRSFYISGAYKF